MTKALDLSTASLAKEINTEHRLAGEAVQSALEHAMKCGELLTKAKEAVGHGEWLPWLEKNCEVSDRQAERYMRLSIHRAELANSTRGTDLSIREAVALLAEPKDEAIPAGEGNINYLEQTIGDGFPAYLRVAESLKEIRDKKLFRGEHATFGEYCQKRWGMSAREANERIETLEIYKNLAAEPKEYEIHELCNLFPRDEWVVSAIAQSLSNGEPLYCPITLYEGKILDGKIRYEACKRAGVNPKFLVFPDDYPEYKGSAKDFVISANVMRQQLSESQRAVIGVGLMDGVLPAEPKQEIPPMESLEDVLRLHHECEENPEMIPLFLQRVGEYGKAERAKIEQLTGLEGIRECNRMRREAEVISNLLNGYVLDTDRKMEQALIEGKEMFRKHYPKMREKQLEELTSSPEMFIEVCNQRIAELEAAV
jgi:hypothetical protein